MSEPSTAEYVKGILVILFIILAMGISTAHLEPSSHEQTTTQH